MELDDPLQKLQKAVTHMHLELTRKYFLMSFRFEKCTPEAFGLAAAEDEDTYILTADHSKWGKLQLYDFGWGNEVGFMRLPKLDFDDLWQLLIESNVQENRYGAAQVIVSDFPDLLFDRVMASLGDASLRGRSTFQEALKILQLDKARNRFPLAGKSSEAITRDYERWKFLGKRVCEILVK